MTSSNVSNLLVQVSGINLDVKDIKSDIKTVDRSFEKTLHNAVSIESPSVVESNIASTKSEQNNFESTKTTINSRESKDLKVKDDNKPSDEELVNKVSEVVDKVKDAIKDELDVSDEDIENAMETLGLTAVDLLNPQNLAQLVANLTGTEDSISLIVSDEFKGILDVVTELTNQLFEENGISAIEIKDIVIDQSQFQPVSYEESLELLNQVKQENDITDSKENIVAFELNQTLNVSEESVNQENVPEVDDKTQVEHVSEQVLVEAKNSNDEQEFDSSNKNSNNENENNLKEVFHKEVTPIGEDAVALTTPKFEPEFMMEENIISLPTGETVKAEEVVNQLVEQAKIMTSSETTTMEMTLNPEGLGKIFLTVTQKGDEVTAKIFTENDAVKQALENQMANLRTQMNQSSTKVTSIEVSVGTHEFEKNLEENQQQDQRRDEQATEGTPRRSSRINLNSLDDLNGLMSEEDLLIAQMMKDNGNTLDFQA